MVGYHITSIHSKSFDGDWIQKCFNTLETMYPSIVNISQVFFSSNFRTFDDVLTGPTVRYHLFESSELIKSLQFGHLLIG